MLQRTVDYQRGGGSSQARSAEHHGYPGPEPGVLHLEVVGPQDTELHQAAVPQTGRGPRLAGRWTLFCRITRLTARRVQSVQGIDLKDKETTRRSHRGYWAFRRCLPRGPVQSRRDTDYRLCEHQPRRWHEQQRQRHQHHGSGFRAKRLDGRAHVPGECTKASVDPDPVEGR